MPLLTDTLRDRYMDDLLRAKPLGPNHPQQKLIYEKVRDGEVWCDNSGQYRDVWITVPSDPMWGYTKEQIFNLGLATRDAVDLYVRKRWFAGKSTYELGRKKATVTRRVNRLWGRLDNLIRGIKREGGVGIYSVRTGYYHGDGDLGNVYATSPEEAQRFADMFFGYLISSDKRLRLEFVRFGGPLEVISLNAVTMQKHRDKMTYMEEQIAKLQKSIDTHRTRIQTLSVIETQQLEAEK